jgi:hypothetical protein
MGEKLRARATSAAASLHGRPEALRHSPELAKALRGLYSRQSADSAVEHLDRFLEQSADSLRTVYRRHAQFNIARCLDEYEGILVLERLRNDRAHLVEVWPFAEEELKAVADAAGVRLSLAGQDTGYDVP